MTKQYEINLATPVFVRYPDGSRIQNGCLADYPGHPVVRSADRIMRFDMLRRITTIHTAVRELSLAMESFPKEWKRQARNHLRAHYGLPLDPLDAFPNN
jgi:hypothetical protein